MTFPCVCTQSDLQKFQYRIQTLQTRSEQQTKVLRVKTQEVRGGMGWLRSRGRGFTVYVCVCVCV